MQLLISVAVAGFATVVCMGLLRPLALRLNLVDVPGGRKSHLGKIPLIGGIGMFVGFVFALLFTPISFEPFRALFAGGALMVFVGVLDDFNEMSPKLKFLLQIVAALIMIQLGGVRLVALGNLFYQGDIFLPYILSVIVTVIATLGVMNAVHMTDGSDGLAGSLSLVEFGLLFYLAFTSHLYSEVLVICVMIGALLAYLSFNFPVYGRARAWAFMGDAGSLFIGFVLSWFLISLSQEPLSIASPMVFVWIVAIPLFDATAAILRRLMKRQSPMLPDAKHLHHLLLRLGCNRVMTVLIMGALSFVMGVTGIMLHKIGFLDCWLFEFFIWTFVIYMLFIYLGWQSVERRTSVKER